MSDIIVNGYAYPYISQTVLREWLPSLTFTASFSYGFTVSGELVDLNDEALLNTVHDTLSLIHQPLCIHHLDVEQQLIFYLTY